MYPRLVDRKLASETCTELKTVGYQCFAPSELPSQVKIGLIKPRNGIHYNINGRQGTVSKRWFVYLPETWPKHLQRPWQGATSP